MPKSKKKVTKRKRKRETILPDYETFVLNLTTRFLSFWLDREHLAVFDIKALAKTAEPFIEKELEVYRNTLKTENVAQWNTWVTDADEFAVPPNTSESQQYPFRLLVSDIERRMFWDFYPSLRRMMSSSVSYQGSYDWDRFDESDVASLNRNFHWELIRFAHGLSTFT